MAMRRKSKVGGSKKKKKKSAKARKAPSRKPARKAAAKPAAGGLETLAHKIVRAAVDPAKFSIKELYNEGCTSREAAGDPVIGHAGLEQKMKQWATMQKGSKWKPRNVFLGKNVICVEWDSEVTLNDGRVVSLQEVAVHEIKGGKIQNERYYYNPMAMS